MKISRCEQCSQCTNQLSSLQCKNMPAMRELTQGIIMPSGSLFQCWHRRRYLATHAQGVVFITFCRTGHLIEAAHIDEKTTMLTVRDSSMSVMIALSSRSSSVADV
jgi:hypothetical protein